MVVPPNLALCKQRGSYVFIVWISTDKRAAGALLVQHQVACYRAAQRVTRKGAGKKGCRDLRVQKKSPPSKSEGGVGG